MSDPLYTRQLDFFGDYLDVLDAFEQPVPMDLAALAMAEGIILGSAHRRTDEPTTASD